MDGAILAAGLDIRELRLEVRFLKRDPGLVQIVFVIWVSEGRFPTLRAEDEEEERRLFYVASTRAKDRLFLVHPEIARDRYRVDVDPGPRVG